MGGGGKSSTSTQTVSIPPEVLARYNAVNARAESVAQQPFQQYTGEFVAPLTPTQQAGIEATSRASQLAQPYYGAATQGLLGAQQGGANYIGAATGAALAGAAPVSPQGLQVGRYMNPFTQSVVGATQAALGQQQGQQLAQQQAEAIRSGAYGGDRAGLQRQALRGQQSLAQAQAIAPLYQQGYQQALQTAQQQQGVGLGAEQANRQAIQQLSQQLAGLGQQGFAMGSGAAQQLAGLGTGAQQAALQGAQAQIGAGTLQQQTQQAQDTAQYQQFLQERGYPFQVAQFLANIAMGTGALSGSTTSSTQPRGFFSNRGGFKTGESLQRSGKAYGGGLDPNSMGGAVYEPGAFERGGYATSGAVVDSNDLAAILAQQRQSFGPFAAAGPYGQAAGAAPHGPSGIVPQQQLTTPKLVTAGALPKKPSGTGSDLGKVYSLADEATKGLSGKGLTERAGEKMGLRDSTPRTAEPGASANATAGSQNPAGGVAPMPTPRDPTATAGEEGLWDKFTGLFRADGGGVMPRHHYADGGSEDSQADEAIPHDPSDVMSGKDPIEGVLKAGSQKRELMKPASGGGSGGGGSGKLGLGKAAGSMIGTAIGGPIGGTLGSMVGSFLPFNEGGVVPRQHFQDGGPEDSFERALKTTLGHEGGYTVDTGGPTMKGISSRANPDVDLERVGKDPEYTRGIYRERYWNPIGASEMDPKFAGVAFDAATNHGVGKTKQMLEEAGGDPAKLLQLRQQHYDQLVTSNPEKYGQYARGWNNRLNSFAKELGMEPLAYAAPEGGIGRAAGQQAIQRATSGEGAGLGAGKPASFIDGIGFNKQTILPLLQGIGAMASSKSISPWAAALQGLGAGAKAYGDVEQQQAQIDQAKAGTTSTLSNIPIGNMIGVFNKDTGKIEYRPRPDYFAPNAFPPKKLEETQNEAIRRGQVATGLIKPSTEGGAYTVDVEPGQTANREFSQYGYTGGDKDAYVVPSTIGTQPALAKKAAEDQAAAQKRTEAGAMVPQTRLETNMLVDSVLGITPTGLAGAGPNQSSRARTVELYNWAARNIFGGAAETEKSNVSNAEIIRKLTTQLGTQFAGSQGFHASGLADALKDAQISGELTKEASIKLASSMYVRQQMEEDFSKYYNNYMKKYGTAYNVQNNFAREMGNQYEEEKKALQRALTPVEKDGKWSSPVTELRKNPALAPQFDAYFKKPGLARMLLGG